jgi:dipeptidyl aminopeptidase/acylaminoacyl peptidase
VLCHGGPHTRDIWGFDEEAQFLASRGYAVFQPNYRGSSGYAPAISYEPEYDFRRMHDDVTDATKTVVRLEMIDSKRVAIMGASFGGFLSVSGMAFEAGLYRCAITNCGVFEWESLIRDSKWEGRSAEYEVLTDRLGKPGSHKADFSKISPFAAAKSISGPILIAHGLSDNVVSHTQSKKLAAELTRLHIAHETFYRNYEGHGFTTFKTRVEYYHAVEKFLLRNLAKSAN